MLKMTRERNVCARDTEDGCVLGEGRFSSDRPTDWPRGPACGPTKRVSATRIRSRTAVGRLPVCSCVPISSGATASWPAKLTCCRFVGGAGAFDLGLFFWGDGDRWFGGGSGVCQTPVLEVYLLS